MFILELLFSLAKMIAFISGNHSFERMYRKHTGLLRFCDLVVVVVVVVVAVVVSVVVILVVVVVVEVVFQRFQGRATKPRLRVGQSCDKLQTKPLFACNTGVGRLGHHPARSKPLSMCLYILQFALVMCILMLSRLH